LPIVLDVGTNNEERCYDPDYLGWRHERITGAEYDEFVEMFVSALTTVFPNVLLQWEDFAEQHAHPLLDRYRDRLCTFNDDIQGTATVALAAVLSGLRQTDRRLRDQRIVIVGGGTAGTGIAEQIVASMIAEGLSDEDARANIFIVDRVGLLTDDMDDLLPFQQPLAQRTDAIAGWDTAHGGSGTLLGVVENARPSVMIGVTGVPGLFTEDVVRAMAATTDHPIIMPLSNPTSRAEATAADVIEWTDGRALVATGSPFDPVVRDGVTHVIAQSNNSYIFPGVGLGVCAVSARRVSDEMFMAAAHALADSVEGHERGDPVLPPLGRIRQVSRAIAIAVGKQAQAQGLAEPSETPVDDLVDRATWQPQYRPYTS
jgi:malate dehydrogenase (oxaloacetate-decarboxylating)